LKNFLRDVQQGLVPTTWWPQEDVGHTDEAKKEIQRILGSLAVNLTPKPVDLLRRIVRIGASKNDLILDSFAGGGTTGHAVLALNQEDGGNRKFILVQMPYDTKDNEKDKFNICQKITAERVRRVMHGYTYATQKGKKEKVEGFGGSFTYARVGNPLFGEYRDFGKKLPAYEELAKYIFYTETSRDFDLKAMNEKTGKIGEHSGTSYYLLYTPNDNEDRQLDLPWLETLQKTDNNRNVVVYCEKIHVHRDDLAKYEQETKRTVRPMVVPYNLK
jgi:adenine-specific DNA-methyltransferase